MELCLQRAEELLYDHENPDAAISEAQRGLQLHEQWSEQSGGRRGLSTLPKATLRHCTELKRDLMAVCAEASEIVGDADDAEMYRDQLFVYQEYLDKVAKRTEAGKPARHGTGSDVGATTATKCHLRQCASCHVQFEEWESGCKPACDECRDAFRERERADPERGKLAEDPAGSCKSQ